MDLYALKNEGYTLSVTLKNKEGEEGRGGEGSKQTFI